MAKKIVIAVLLIVLAAFAARALIYPAVMQNTSVSPTLNKGETMLISRFERFTNQPFQRFEVVAIIPPFLKGRAYNPVETPLGTFADLTGIPIAPMPSIELQRVIALPSETVVIRKGLGVFVDGKLLDESSYTKDTPHSDLFVLADIVRESLEEGVLQSYENSEAPIVVPPDMVFVLPDDRKNFSGSNEWGFLPQSRVVGKVPFKIAKSGIEAIKTPAVKFATEKIAINDDGVRALDKGEYTKAIHLFKSSLAIDNNFELARDNLSIAYNNFAIQSADKPDVALDSLHKALFLDPDNELTKKNLAGILKRMGKDASKYEDRIALGKDALKHHKTISALVEYRAAVKLHPSPEALAKVSALEAQCNFPPHAIPEDLVTATVDNTGTMDKAGDDAIATTAAATTNEVSQSTSSESRMEFGQNTAGIPATKIDHEKPAAVKEPVVANASDESKSKPSTKKLDKKSKNEKDVEAKKALLSDKEIEESLPEKLTSSKKKDSSKDKLASDGKPVSKEDPASTEPFASRMKVFVKKASNEKTDSVAKAVQKTEANSDVKSDGKSEAKSEVKPGTDKVLADSKEAVSKEPNSKEKTATKEKAAKEKLASNETLNSRNKKSKKEQASEEQEESESSKKIASHKDSTQEKSASSKEEKSTSDKAVGTSDKAVGKNKTETSAKSGTESKKIASNDLDTLPDDLVPIERHTLKPSTSSGFDLGSFMKNLVSSFSAKNNPSEIEVTPEGYRGPPRLKKSP